MLHTFSTSRLTTDSLCFTNGWLVCTSIADFHRQVKCHTRHTKKNEEFCLYGIVLIFNVIRLTYISQPKLYILFNGWFTAIRNIYRLTILFNRFKRDYSRNCESCRKPCIDCRQRMIIRRTTKIIN